MEFLDGETLAERLRKVRCLSMSCSRWEWKSRRHWRQHIAPGLCTEISSRQHHADQGGCQADELRPGEAGPLGGSGSGLAPLLSTARTLSAPSPASPLTTAGSIVDDSVYVSRTDRGQRGGRPLRHLLPSARCSTRRQPASARFRAKARSCSFGDFGKRSGAHQRNQAARAGGARLPGGNLPRERP